jgi:nucleoid DNA-binding protein
MIASLARSLPRASAASAVARRGISSLFDSPITDGTPTDANGSTTSTNTAFTTSDGILSKADLIKIVSDEHGLTPAQSVRVLGTVFDTVVEAVATKHTVKISGFGKFTPAPSPARWCVNPQDPRGSKIWVEEMVRVRFQPFTNFKECVKNGGGSRKKEKNDVDEED